MEMASFSFPSFGKRKDTMDSPTLGACPKEMNEKSFINLNF